MTRNVVAVRAWVRALERVVQDRRELEVKERSFVGEARKAGASWQEIGDALGIARQNAHRKFAGRVR